MSETLERYVLPPDVQKRLDELRDLSDKAEAGDKEARRELKQAVRESAPEVIARASDVARSAQHMLIGTVAAGSSLRELALSGRLDMMREEIAGAKPTPLETLLTEQIVSCWLWLQLLDAFISGQFQYPMPDGSKRVAMSYLLKMVKLQESASRRFLSVIRTLAQVRKTQASTPALHLTQINVR